MLLMEPDKLFHSLGPATLKALFCIIDDHSFDEK